MRRTILALACALAGTALSAQNPVIRDQYTADPTARVFDGKVWLYASHDIISPVEPERRWFCMADYHCFSSEDLVHWTDHGVILDQKDVPWGNPEGYSMWAPDCVERGGKYYFYFPNAPREGRGFAVGVAVADRPDGPFTPQEKSIQGVFGIDPCCLLASDGNAYLYWSGMGFSGAKLKENMTELDGTPVRLDTPLPAGGLKEGPFVFEREGKFYLTYPWVQDRTESLVYAMADSPLGPFEYKGKIMEKSLSECWTNHHSFVEYQGQWYLFYHHNFFSPRDDKRRSVQIEKLYFNADGTIQEVKPTMRGVGINKATEKIQIDRYSEAAAGVTTAHVDTTRAFSGDCATMPTKGSWIKYDDVDFSCITDGYIVLSAKASDDTEFCIREGNAKGKVIARFKMTVRPPEPPAGAAANPMMSRFNRDLRNQWLNQTATLEYTPKGVTNLVVTNEGNGALSIDWVQFKNRPKYFSAITTPSAQPDEEGFIRRWMLLEPIDKPNSGNTVFTDSYLREHFNRDYFKGQQTIVPKNGQKVTAVFKQEQAPAGFGRGMQQAPAQPEVKTVKQTLTWHALDSENFNVKLFRFAEKYGEKVYGVLFWAVTIIDCDEEIKNVRLAVGSNSASMWWLNGEETLLLSGDRRMVKDDAMSNRITLKKGRNILRGAIINGPGMSDFCVRFLDEKGNPVKNYSIKAQ